MAFKLLQTGHAVGDTTCKMYALELRLMFSLVMLRRFA